MVKGIEEMVFSPDGQFGCERIDLWPIVKKAVDIQ